MALRLAAEDIPAKSRGDGESVVWMVGIFNEGSVIGTGFRDKEILGEIRSVIAFSKRGSCFLAHAKEEGCEVAASAAVDRVLIRSGDIEGVLSRGRWRLAVIQEPLHVFRAGADFVLSPTLGERRDHVLVLAGVDKGVVVSRAADASAQIVEIHVGKGLVHFIRGSRGGKSQGGKTVDCALARIAALILVVAREGVAQLQYGGRVDGVIVPNDEIAAICNVLGVVQIPRVIESIDT